MILSAKMINMRHLLLTRYIMMWLGFILIGGSAGYIFYAQIGCEPGTCLISSDPVNSVIWGGLMGAVAGMPGIEKFYRILVKRENK